MNVSYIRVAVVLAIYSRETAATIEYIVAVAVAIAAVYSIIPVVPS